jgi:NADPH-dependent glutamate synthase beta subunit-like oxidoreductase
MAPEFQGREQLLPPCTAACPVQTDARRYVGLILQGRYAELEALGAEFRTGLAWGKDFSLKDLQDKGRHFFLIRGEGGGLTRKIP